MWEGDTEDTIRRSLEGQFPQVMPDNFHSRQQIYLFASIKAKSGQRISLDQKAAAAQDGKHQRIIGDRHSQLPRVPSKSVIISVMSYIFKVLQSFHRTPTCKLRRPRQASSSHFTDEKNEVSGSKGTIKYNWQSRDRNFSPMMFSHCDVTSIFQSGEFTNKN